MVLFPSLSFSVGFGGRRYRKEERKEKEGERAPTAGV
jgi:hypothetical protein